MKEEKQQKRVGSPVGGSSHVIRGEVLPTWDELALEEEPCDDNIAHDWAFVQNGNVDRAEFDTSTREIRCDASNIKKHVCNETSSTSDKLDRLWELFLDNQSTYDVIIN